MPLAEACEVQQGSAPVPALRVRRVLWVASCGWVRKGILW